MKGLIQSRPYPNWGQTLIISIILVNWGQTPIFFGDFCGLAATMVVTAWLGRIASPLVDLLSTSRPAA